MQYKRGNTKGLHKHSTQATTFVNLYSSLRGTKTLMLTTFLCPTASLLIADPNGHPRKDLELIMRQPYPPVANARESLRPTPHYEPPREFSVTRIHTWKHNAWREPPWCREHTVLSDIRERALCGQAFGLRTDKISCMVQNPGRITANLIRQT